MYLSKENIYRDVYDSETILRDRKEIKRLLKNKRFIDLVIIYDINILGNVTADILEYFNLFKILKNVL